MEHQRSKDDELRLHVCSAFQALANVLLTNREAWQFHRPACYSLERFLEKVDRLCGTGIYAGLRSEDPDPSEREQLKEDLVLRILERMTALVDHVEDLRSGLQHAAALLPPRSALPLDNAGIVAYCREVHTRLLPVPGATTVRGGFAARMRLLNASLSIYEQISFSAERKEPGMRGVDHYARRRDNCLHLLLMQVDPHMHKFAHRIAFQDAYYEARTVVMRLTVAARGALYDAIGLRRG